MSILSDIGTKVGAKFKAQDEKIDGIAVGSGAIVGKNFQVDNITRAFTTAWADGKIWNNYAKQSGTFVQLFWRCPFRNDSAGWGGGYIEIQYSTNGGTNYKSVGNSGYDGGVMNTGHGAIGSMSGMIVFDMQDVLDSSNFKVKFRHRSYDGTVKINSNHHLEADYAPNTPVSTNVFYTNIQIIEMVNP